MVSFVNLTRRMGVRPRGAQVRTAIGTRLKPRFIYPDDGGLILLGFFLSAGQRSCDHFLMASSLR